MYTGYQYKILQGNREFHVPGPTRVPGPQHQLAGLQPKVGLRTTTRSGGSYSILDLLRRLRPDDNKSLIVEPWVDSNLFDIVLDFQDTR